MLKFIAGKKTYITAIGSLIYAAAGYYTHNLDSATALQIAQVAVMGAFIRHGISTSA